MHKFLKFIFGIKLYMFRTVPPSSIRSFSLYTQQWYMSYSLCWLLASRIRTELVPSWFCSQSVWHIPLLCVQWEAPGDGQRNCPKHIEFYSKNKFDKLVPLVGFIIRICHDVRSPERQIIILHQHVSAIPVTFIRMPGNKNTFNIRYPGDGHWSGRNMLVKYNNMWWKILIHVHMLFCDTSINHSLPHGHGTYKRK